MSSHVPPSSPVRVMLIEDQTAIREMLAAFVAAMPGYTVVGEAGSVSAALVIAGDVRPDVVVLDWMLLGGLGLEFLQKMKLNPAPGVLVFSANTTDLAVREALGAGVKGYLEKGANFAEFTAALKAVAAGQTYLGPLIARNVRRIVRSQSFVGGPTELSVREREVLQLISTGLSSKEIAAKLGLSVRTVENHRASIARRTGLHSVAQLTLHAVRLGLVEAPSGLETSR